MWPIVEENLDCEQEHPLPQLSTFAKGQTPTDERVPRRAGRHIRPKVRRVFGRGFVKFLSQSRDVRPQVTIRRSEGLFFYVCLSLSIVRLRQLCGSRDPGKFRGWLEGEGSGMQLSLSFWGLFLWIKGFPTFTSRVQDSPLTVHQLQ